jgi:ABC-type microcin C transport system permease subunit YejE
MESVRVILCLAAHFNWIVHHMDVKSAFLNGKLLEEVYASQPLGFIKKGQEAKF